MVKATLSTMATLVGVALGSTAMAQQPVAQPADPSASAAQAAKAKADEAKAKTAADDAKASLIEQTFTKPGEFSVPDSPAAWMLGDNAPTMSRPQTVSELAMELSRIGSGDGETEGFSVVFAPGKLFKKEGAIRAERQTDDWDRVELSIGATAPKDADNVARRAAFGITYTAFDDGDPRLDGNYALLYSCMKKKVYDNPDFAGSIGMPAFPGDNRPWAEAVEMQVTNCKKQAADIQRSGNSLKLGLGKGLGQAPGSGWRDGGAGLWLAGAYVPGSKVFGSDGVAAKDLLGKRQRLEELNQSPEAAPLPKPSRLSFLYRLQASRFKDWIAEDSSWQTKTTREATLQLRYDADGNGTDALLEMGLSRDADKARTSKRIALGLEKQVYPGLWLVLSITGRSANDPDAPSTLVLGKLKYQFGGDSLLGKFLGDPKQN